MSTISQLPAQLTLRKFRGDDLVVSLDFDNLGTSVSSTTVYIIT
jgi:hypothetical protein